MGTVLTGLAVAIALARRPVGAALRGAGPVPARLGGLVLAVAGAYVTWYAVYEIRLATDDDADAGPVAIVTRWSGQVSTWLDQVGPGRIAAAVLVLIVAAAAVGRRRSLSPDAGVDDQATPG